MRNQAVLVQITTINAILLDSGVTSDCIGCINDPKRGGCCQNCSNLGPNGCMDKPMACALWLCDSMKQKYPTVVKQLNEIADKYPWGVAYNFRQASIEAEELL
jgi:hypothetical protein